MHSVKNYVTDMDGVLIKGKQLIPGADRFLQQLEELGKPYLVLTNNPIYTPRDLAHRLCHRRERLDPGHPRHRLGHHRYRPRLRRPGRDRNLQL